MDGGREGGREGGIEGRKGETCRYIQRQICRRVEFRSKYLISSR